MKKTLFDKIWERHVVKQVDDNLYALYIDIHYIHEVTSPQAFTGLNNRGLKVFRPKQTIATADHNVPTIDQHLPIREELSRIQVDTLTQNCKDHNIELFGLGHPNQGIVHVIGPELGITKPGMTIVCGDSHTSTHGAYGCIAFGIGTSEVEMVLATQCLLQSKPKQMRITVDGPLNPGVTAKDIILYILSKLTSSGATGHAVEYAGSTIESLSIEGRMTICNMSIELGAKCGLMAYNLTSAGGEIYATDDDAIFDQEYHFNASDIEPMITYGTNPGQGIKISEKLPGSDEYMKGHKIDYVFIGSCTNSRIEDLRAVASIVKGKKKADDIIVWIVPGSKRVEKQAKDEGLDKIFEEAGFQLRQPGCSACLGMNEDKIPPGKYCISTSNRNFEGRQGPGSITFLASPLTAAAAAITGKITDPREL